MSMQIPTPQAYASLPDEMFIIGEDDIIENIILPKQIKTKTHGEQLLAL